MRIGHGYDVHRLTENRKLVLGGVEIPYSKGLLGHSDADVLSHAIADSLLGAAALGDIGQLFPDTDPRYEGVDSLVLLKKTVLAVREAGWRIGNIDATVVAQAPKLKPFIPSMRENLRRGCFLSQRKSNHGRRPGLYRRRGRNCRPCGLPAFICRLISVKKNILRGYASDRA